MLKITPLSFFKLLIFSNFLDLLFKSCFSQSMPVNKQVASAALSFYDQNYVFRYRLFVFDFKKNMKFHGFENNHVFSSTSSSFFCISLKQLQA